MGKGENAANQHFHQFPPCFLFIPERISVKFIWSSTNAFNLDQSKLLSFRKELKNCEVCLTLFENKSMGESNTVVRNLHVQQYCSNPLKYAVVYGNKRLTLSNMTNFRLFQIQSLCRRQLQTWWKFQKVLQKFRKHCGKRRNCSYEQFLLFPQCFQKTSTANL